ncbi:MAG: hypothetical protein GTO41_21535 [Burkholderiales bacterium]|nr:hypothetical protein [Burkholderiales bacterium]
MPHSTSASDTWQFGIRHLFFAFSLAALCLGTIRLAVFYDLPSLGFIGVLSLGSISLGLTLARTPRMISFGSQIAFSVLGLGVACVAAFGAFVIVKSTGPAPGDIMSLMFLPMIFFSLVGLSAVSIFAGAFVSPYNRFFMLGAVAFLAAFVLGLSMYLVESGWLESAANNTWWQCAVA